MKKVYSAIDPTHAQLMLGILEDNGIPGVIQGEQAFYLRGEVPVVYPSIWVDDAQMEAARALCEVFDKRKLTPETRPSWTCPDCGEVIDGEFTECWKCADKGSV